ncbi:MAG: ABC transporter permease [Nitriliruptoraceae bacterium]|nr:ABC transporter permease [Nitriliruptoraceae bacterium]
MAPRTTDALEGSAVLGAQADASTRDRRRTLVRTLGMPVSLAIVLAMLTLTVLGLELDAVEARELRLGVILTRTWEHVALTLSSTVIVMLLAIPVGAIATRPGRGRFAAAIIGVGNAGQAIPAIGLMGLVVFLAASTPLLPRAGAVPAVLALVATSFLAILRNTVVGLTQIDRSVLEAARGMGMSAGRLLRTIELPLAVPVILAGVRAALALNVGAATLAFLVGAGALGDVIVTGIASGSRPILLTAAVLTASLALLLDHLAGLLEGWLTPAGL